MELHNIVPRRVRELLADQMTIEPVIALHRPRSVGKSTVLHGLASERGVSAIDLDDGEVRETIQGTCLLRFMGNRRCARKHARGTRP